MGSKVTERTGRARPLRSRVAIGAGAGVVVLALRYGPAAGTVELAGIITGAVALAAGTITVVILVYRSARIRAGRSAESPQVTAYAQPALTLRDLRAMKRNGAGAISRPSPSPRIVSPTGGRRER